jgi:hypothetical protein
MGSTIPILVFMVGIRALIMLSDRDGVLDLVLFLEIKNASGGICMSVNISQISVE